MTHRFVLVTSPVLGPTSWVPVAQRLLAGGHDAVVPDLRHVGRGEGRGWARAAHVVVDAMGQLDDDGPVVLVAHSGAGLLLPAVAASSPRAVSCAVLVDAALPAESGDSPAAPQDLLERLRGLADDDGLLPRWSDWWPPAEIEQLVPDATARALVLGEQPRLPLSWFEQTIPVPVLWAAIPQGFVRLSAAYDREAEAVAASGGPVRMLDGGHLLAVVAPDVVAAAIESLAELLAG